MTRNTTLTDRTETALADFTAWVESCATLDALQEAATHVNRLGRLVKARHEALQAAAKPAFRVGGRVVLIRSRSVVGTIIKTTAKYAHISLDSNSTVRVGFMEMEPLPETDARYSDAARDRALGEAKHQQQLSRDRVSQWRKEHVTIIGMTDEQRTKMEKGLDEDLAAGR
jgi:hypothetical protein